MQEEDLYLDPKETMSVLKFNPEEDIKAVIRETLLQCL
ncbi:NAD-dependent epimerase/dehydratase [Erysipelothrix rhusiopathiae SY1027]|nr:NAD-dependent epimerase/dehydratase [Erysipelothrix rhusiopathiae SY1027]